MPAVDWIDSNFSTFSPPLSQVWVKRTIHLKKFFCQPWSIILWVKKALMTCKTMRHTRRSQQHKSKKTTKRFVHVTGRRGCCKCWYVRLRCDKNLVFSKSCVGVTWDIVLQLLGNDVDNFRKCLFLVDHTNVIDVVKLQDGVNIVVGEGANWLRGRLSITSSPRLSSQIAIMANWCTDTCKPSYKLFELLCHYFQGHVTVQLAVNHYWPWFGTSCQSSTSCTPEYRYNSRLSDDWKHPRSWVGYHECDQIETASTHSVGVRPSGCTGTPRVAPRSLSHLGGNFCFGANFHRLGSSNLISDMKIE